jgi:hypothetical protein
MIKEKLHNNLIDKKFGRLLVIEKTNKRINRNVVWKCLCDCGNIIEVKGASLSIKNTKSCGCINKENIRVVGKKRL